MTQLNECQVSVISRATDDGTKLALTLITTPVPQAVVAEIIKARVARLNETREVAEVETSSNANEIAVGISDGGCIQFFVASVMKQLDDADSRAKQGEPFREAVKS